MSEDDFIGYLAKCRRRGKRFEPYSQEIITLYKENKRRKVYTSSVFDVLEERHGELPASERTLRNYINYLSESGKIDTGAVVRMYQKVPEAAPGSQIQVDFGVEKQSCSQPVYIFAALLSHSRYRYVAVQKSPFTTIDVILHLLDCFIAFGGKPEEMVIDQDAVLVVSENSGDIIYTHTIQSAIAGAERVFEIINENPTVTNSEDAEEAERLDGKVEFKDGTFSYVPGQQVLKNISFTAEPGQIIAFVGATGAGKTTIINLLTRFYDIDSGSILLDGKDFQDFTKESLRRQLGVVLQDTFLFSAIVADNIRYGRLDAADEEVMEGRTSFVIAHRLNTIRNADVIIVIDNGMIVEKGSHRELIQRGRYYYRLYTRQFGDMIGAEG